MCKPNKDRKKYSKFPKNQILTNKSSLNSVSPFHTNNNVRNYAIIILNEKGRLINDELEVAETLNSPYINIVETTCRQPTQALSNPMNQEDYVTLVDAIISS